jgi:hypothetical protein
MTRCAVRKAGMANGKWQMANGRVPEVHTEVLRATEPHGGADGGREWNARGLREGYARQACVCPSRILRMDWGSYEEGMKANGKWKMENGRWRDGRRDVFGNGK